MSTPSPPFSSPTRAGRSAWRALQAASRTTRTAATQRRPTHRAATRDASSRPPLTATEASAPPQTENSIPVRQTHRRYRRTFLEERDPVGWRRELLEASSPNLRIGGPTRARPSPSAPSPPLLHASGLLLPGGGDSGCLLCRQAATPFADPHLSLPPPAMCYMVGGY